MNVENTSVRNRSAAMEALPHVLSSPLGRSSRYVSSSTLPNTCLVPPRWARPHKRPLAAGAERWEQENATSTRACKFRLSTLPIITVYTLPMYATSSSAKTCYNRFTHGTRGSKAGFNMNDETHRHEITRQQWRSSHIP